MARHQYNDALPFADAAGGPTGVGPLALTVSFVAIGNAKPSAIAAMQFVILAISAP